MFVCCSLRIVCRVLLGVRCVMCLDRCLLFVVFGSGGCRFAFSLCVAFHLCVIIHCFLSFVVRCAWFVVDCVMFDGG